MPDQQFYIYARLDRTVDPVRADAAVNLPSPSAPAKLDQVLPLPAPLRPIRLTRYLPRAKLEQTVVPSESAGAAPAILLSIDGPTQSHQRWLVADDPERNRLTSMIGTWRYMPVADQGQRDELFTQFEQEFTRDPILTVAHADGGSPRTLGAKPGATLVLDDLGCTILVKRFFPDFARDEKSKKPMSKSDLRANPAALVEIEYKGKKEDRWVFARFPNYRHENSTVTAIQVTLDCPVEPRRNTADFALLTIGRVAHEVWVRHKGRTTSKPLSLDTPVKVPDTQYAFHIADYIPASRLNEEYHPVEGRGGVPALQITTTDASGGKVAMWLALDRQRILRTPLGPMAIGFGSRATGAHEVGP